MQAWLGMPYMCSSRVVYPGPQDFQQLYQAQLFARACPWWEQGGAGADLRLAPWLQQYASRTWQDRIDTERSFTRLQQASLEPLRSNPETKP